MKGTFITTLNGYNAMKSRFLHIFKKCEKAGPWSWTGLSWWQYFGKFGVPRMVSPVTKNGTFSDQNENSVTLSRIASRQSDKLKLVAIYMGLQCAAV